MIPATPNPAPATITMTRMGSKKSGGPNGAYCEKPISKTTKRMTDPIRTLPNNCKALPNKRRFGRAISEFTC